MKLENKISDIEDVLSIAAAVPLVGSVAAAGKLLLGLAQTISAIATTVIFSSGAIFSSNQKII